MKPKIVVCASGTKNSGGSGFENLVHKSREGVLDADIVAVVSNHERGGVYQRAERLGVPFVYMHLAPENHSYILKNKRIQSRAEDIYTDIVRDVGAEWVALSGWIKKVTGLDPAKTFNIHPALLSQLNGRFGGVGMWGAHVHEAVHKAFVAGEITESGFSMHFVTNEYDRGPVFFEHRVPITIGMSAHDIGVLVNTAEHQWQPIVTNKVVHKDICWDGVDIRTVRGAEGV